MQKGFFVSMDKITKTGRGRAGEALAVSYLKSKNIKVLHLNYRYQRAEIDIIATDDVDLIIVEVKTRQNNVFGFPEEAISKAKENRLQEAGYAYKQANEIEMPLRFDVIAISIEEKEIKHFKGAF